MSETRSDFMVFDRRAFEEREYWLKQLSARGEVSGLRPDFARPAVFSAETESLTLDLEGDLYQRVLQLTKGGPFLLYTTLLTTLKVCLSKYGGGRRIAVGSPARLLQGATSQPYNALTIVDEVGDESTFRELLMSVRQTLLDAYARQLYPFERVLKDLGLGGVSNRCPLFDVALALKGIHGDLPHVKNDITITFEQEAESAKGLVTYNKRLFRVKTIERFAGHFKTVLSHALENTATRVGEIKSYTPDEERRLVHEWNETKGVYDYDECIHRLFEQQAERNPLALAVAAAGPSAGTVTRQYSRAWAGSSSSRSAHTAGGRAGA